MSFVEKLKREIENIAVVSETEGYSLFELSNKGMRISLKVSDMTYLIHINYQSNIESENFNNISFEGGLNDVTVYYLKTIFVISNELPFVVASVFFDKNFFVNDLSILVERLVYAKLEFNYFTIYFLDTEDWDGCERELKTKYSTIKVRLNFENIPFIETEFYKKELVDFTQNYTMFDWLLYFIDNYSWVESDMTSHSPKTLSRLEDYVYSSFANLLTHFGAETNADRIKKEVIQIPMNNKGVLYCDFSMNNFGCCIRLFTEGRPYKHYNLKLPIRDDIEKNYKILGAFIDILVKDINGEYVNSIFNFYRNIENIYIGMLAQLSK